MKLKIEMIEPLILEGEPVYKIGFETAISKEEFEKMIKQASNDHIIEVELTK